MKEKIRDIQGNIMDDTLGGSNLPNSSDVDEAQVQMALE
jgi:hypothetical protein